MTLLDLEEMGHPDVCSPKQLHERAKRVLITLATRGHNVLITEANIQTVMTDMGNDGSARERTDAYPWEPECR